MKDKILLIEEFPEEKYRHIDLNSLITYTIDYLEKADIQTSFENICVAGFKLFPKKFSLVCFSQFPDAARVGRALLQCRPKYQNLALGNVKKGFILTKMGEFRAKITEKQLTSVSLVKVKIKQSDESRRTIDNYKHTEEIFNSNIYKKFASNKLNEIEEVEFYDLLGAGAYTSPKKLRAYFADIKKIAEESNNKKLDIFLDELRKKFNYLFRGD